MMVSALIMASNKKVRLLQRSQHWFVPKPLPLTRTVLIVAGIAPDTCLLINFGHACTHIFPIHKGSVCKDAIVRCQVCGRARHVASMDVRFEVSLSSAMLVMHRLVVLK